MNSDVLHVGVSAVQSVFVTHSTQDFVVGLHLFRVGGVAVVQSWLPRHATQVNVVGSHNGRKLKQSADVRQSTWTQAALAEQMYSLKGRAQSAFAVQGAQVLVAAAQPSGATQSLPSRQSPNVLGSLGPPPTNVPGRA